MGIHDDHRARMRARFQDSGASGFADHELLEILLYYAIPRKDTNAIAHSLIERFGSLNGVFEASVGELSVIPGLGENSALFLHLLEEISLRCRAQSIVTARRYTCLDTTGEMLVPLFDHRQNEELYVMCLDASGRLRYADFIFRGSINSAAFHIRPLTELAIRTKAVSLVLAHNHPNGLLVPSGDDIDTTRRIADSLLSNSIELKEHFIIAGHSYLPILRTLHSQEKRV